MIKILPRLLSPFHQHVINIIYCNKLIHIIILIHPCFPLSGAIYVIMYSSKQQAVNIIVAPHRCRRATWVAVRRNPVSVVAVVWSVQVLQAIKLRKNIRPSSFVHGRWLRLILLSKVASQHGKSSGGWWVRRGKETWRDKCNYKANKWLWQSRIRCATPCEANWANRHGCQRRSSSRSTFPAAREVI